MLSIRTPQPNPKVPERNPWFIGNPNLKEGPSQTKRGLYVPNRSTERGERILRLQRGWGGKRNPTRFAVSPLPAPLCRPSLPPFLLPRSPAAIAAAAAAAATALLLFLSGGGGGGGGGGSCSGCCCCC